MADATTYMTKEEFSTNRGYASWALFIADNDFPSQSVLNIMRKRMYAIINKYIGGTGSKDDFLMNMEYTGVEMMITETQARLAGEPRDYFIPHDYLYERDRKILDAYDAVLNRGVTSG